MRPLPPDSGGRGLLRQFVRRQRAPSLQVIEFGSSSFPLQQPFFNPTTSVDEPVIRPSCDEPSESVTVKLLPA